MNKSSDAVLDLDGAVRRVWRAVMTERDQEAADEQLRDIKRRLPITLQLDSSSAAQSASHKEAELEVWRVLCGPLAALPEDAGDTASAEDPPAKRVKREGGAGADVSLLRSLMALRDRTGVVLQRGSMSTSVEGRIMAKCLTIFTEVLQSPLVRSATLTQKKLLWDTVWDLLSTSEALNQYKATQSECLAVLRALIDPEGPDPVEPCGKGETAKREIATKGIALSAPTIRQVVEYCLNMTRRKTCGSRVKCFAVDILGLLCRHHAGAMMESGNHSRVAQSLLRSMEELISLRAVDQLVAEGLVMGLSGYLLGFPLGDELPDRIRLLLMDFTLSGLSIAVDSTMHNYQLPKVLLRFLALHSDNPFVAPQLLLKAEKCLEVLMQLWCHKNQLVRRATVPAVMAVTQSLAHQLSSLIHHSSNEYRTVVERLLKRVRPALSSPQAHSRREVSFALIVAGHLARAIRCCLGNAETSQIAEELGQYITVWLGPASFSSASTSASLEQHDGPPTPAMELRHSDVCYFLGPFTSSLACFVLEMGEVSPTVFSAARQLLDTVLLLLPREAFFDSLRLATASAVRRLLAALESRQLASQAYLTTCICQRTIQLVCGDVESAAAEDPLGETPSDLEDEEVALYEEVVAPEREAVLAQAAQAAEEEHRQQRTERYAAFWNSVLYATEADGGQDLGFPFEQLNGCHIRQVLRRELLRTIKEFIGAVDLSVSIPTSSSGGQLTSGVGGTAGLSEVLESASVARPNSLEDYTMFLGIVEFYNLVAPSVWEWPCSPTMSEFSDLRDEESAAASSEEELLITERLCTFVEVVISQSLRYPHVSGLLKVLYRTLLAVTAKTSLRSWRHSSLLLKPFRQLLRSFLARCGRRLSIYTDDLLYQCSMCVLVLCNETVLVSPTSEEKAGEELSSAELSKALCVVLEELNTASSVSEMPVRLLEELHHNAHKAEELMETYLDHFPERAAVVLGPILRSDRFHQYHRLTYVAAFHGVDLARAEVRQRKEASVAPRRGGVRPAHETRQQTIPLPLLTGGGHLAFPIGKLLARVGHLCLHAAEPASRSAAGELYHAMTTFVVGEDLVAWYEEVLATVIHVAALSDHHITQDLFRDLLHQCVRWLTFQAATSASKEGDECLVRLLFTQLRSQHAAVRKVSTDALSERLRYIQRMRYPTSVAGGSDRWGECTKMLLLHLQNELRLLSTHVESSTDSSSTRFALQSGLALMQVVLEQMSDQRCGDSSRKETLQWTELAVETLTRHMKAKGVAAAGADETEDGLMLQFAHCLSAAGGLLRASGTPSPAALQDSTPWTAAKLSQLCGDLLRCCLWLPREGGHVLVAHERESPTQSMWGALVRLCVALEDEGRRVTGHGCVPRLCLGGNGFPEESGAADPQAELEHQRQSTLQKLCCSTEETTLSHRLDVFCSLGLHGFLFRIKKSRDPMRRVYLSHQRGIPTEFLSEILQPMFTEISSVVSLLADSLSVGGSMNGVTKNQYNHEFCSTFLKSLSRFFRFFRSISFILDGTAEDICQMREVWGAAARRLLWSQLAQCLAGLFFKFPLYDLSLTDQQKLSSELWEDSIELVKAAANTNHNEVMDQFLSEVVAAVQRTAPNGLLVEEAFNAVWRLETNAAARLSFYSMAVLSSSSALPLPERNIWSAVVEPAKPQLILRTLLSRFFHMDRIETNSSENEYLVMQCVVLTLLRLGVGLSELLQYCCMPFHATESDFTAVNSSLLPQEGKVIRIVTPALSSFLFAVQFPRDQLLVEQLARDLTSLVHYPMFFPTPSHTGVTPPPPVLTLNTAWCLTEHFISTVVLHSVSMEGVTDEGSLWLQRALEQLFRGVLDSSTSTPASTAEESACVMRLNVVEYLYYSFPLQDRVEQLLYPIRQNLIPVVASVFQKICHLEPHRSKLLLTTPLVCLLTRAASLLSQVFGVLERSPEEGGLKEWLVFPLLDVGECLLKEVTQYELPLHWKELLPVPEAFPPPTSWINYKDVVRLVVCVGGVVWPYRPPLIRLLLPIFSQEDYPHMRELRSYWMTALVLHVKNSRALFELACLASEWQQPSHPMPPAMWISISTYVLFPTVRLFSESQRVEFFEQRLHGLLQMASLMGPGGAPLTSDPSERDLRHGTNAFELLERMCQDCSSESLRGVLNETVVPAAQKPGTGKELIKKLIDVCRKAIEMESSTTSGAALWLRYHQAAHRCLIGIVITTQTQEMLFVKLLLQAMGPRFWHHVVDVTVCHQPEYRPSPEDDVVPEKTLMIDAGLEPLTDTAGIPRGYRRPRPTEGGHHLTGMFIVDERDSTQTPATLGLRMPSIAVPQLLHPHPRRGAVSRGSRSRLGTLPDVPRGSGTSASASTASHAEDMEAVESGSRVVVGSKVLVDAVWRSTNSAGLLKVLDVLISRTPPAPSSLTPSLTVTPVWVKEVAALLSSPNIHLNVKLVMLRLVSLRSSFFDRFAPELHESLLEVAFSDSLCHPFNSENDTKSGLLHFIARDAIIMVLQWQQDKGWTLTSRSAEMLLHKLSATLTSIPFSSSARKEIRDHLGLLKMSYFAAGPRLLRPPLLATCAALFLSVLLPALRDKERCRMAIEVCGVLLHPESGGSATGTAAVPLGCLCGSGEAGQQMATAVYQELARLLEGVGEPCAEVMGMELVCLKNSLSMTADSKTLYDYLFSLAQQAVFGVQVTSFSAAVRRTRCLVRYEPQFLGELLPSVLQQFNTLDTHHQILVLESMACSPALSATKYDWIHAQFAGKWEDPDPQMHKLRLSLLQLLTKVVEYLPELEDKNKLAETFISFRALSAASEASITDEATKSWAFFQFCLAVATAAPQIKWLPPLLTCWARKNQSFLIQDAVLKFADAEVVPAEFAARFEYLFHQECISEGVNSAAHAKTVEAEGWLRHTALLLLAVTRRSASFTSNDYLFRKPLSDGVVFMEKDFRRTAHCTGRITGTVRCTPLFSASQARGACRGRKGPVIGLQHTFVGTGFTLAPSSQLWSQKPDEFRTVGPSHSSGVKATPRGGDGAAFFFTAAPPPTAGSGLESQHRGTFSSTLVVPSSRVLQHRPTRPTESSVSRADGTAVADETAAMIRAAAAKRRRQGEESVLQRWQRGRTPVTLYRRYQEGDFPDIQVSLEALVTPLQALCLHDVGVASVVCSCLVEELCVSLRHLRLCGVAPSDTLPHSSNEPAMSVLRTPSPGRDAPARADELCATLQGSLQHYLHSLSVEPLAAMLSESSAVSFFVSEVWTHWMGMHEEAPGAEDSTLLLLRYAKAVTHPTLALNNEDERCCIAGSFAELLEGHLQLLLHDSSPEEGTSRLTDRLSLCWAALHRCSLCCGEEDVGWLAAAKWMRSDAAELLREGRRLEELGAYRDAEELYSNWLKEESGRELEREGSELECHALGLVRQLQREAAHKLLGWDLLADSFKAEDAESIESGLAVRSETMALRAATALRQGITTRSTLAAGLFRETAASEAIQAFERAAALLAISTPEESISYAHRALSALLLSGSSGDLHRYRDAYRLTMVLDAAHALRQCTQLRDTGMGEDAKLRAIRTFLLKRYGRWDALELKGSYADAWLLDDVLMLHRLVVTRLEDDVCFDDPNVLREIQTDSLRTQLELCKEGVHLLLDQREGNACARSLITYAAVHCKGSKESLQELALSTLFFEIAFHIGVNAEDRSVVLHRLQGLRRRLPAESPNALELATDLARAEVMVRTASSPKTALESSVSEGASTAVSAQDGLLYAEVFARAVTADLHNSAAVLETFNNLLAQLATTETSSASQSASQTAEDTLWLLFVRALLHRLRQEGGSAASLSSSGVARHIPRLWQSLRRPCSQTDPQWHSVVTRLFCDSSRGDNEEPHNREVPLGVWVPWVCQILYTFLATRHLCLAELLYQLVSFAPEVCFYPLHAEYDALQELMEEPSHPAALRQCLSPLLQLLCPTELPAPGEEGSNGFGPPQRLCRWLYFLHHPDQRSVEWESRLETALRQYWKTSSAVDEAKAQDIFDAWRRDCIDARQWRKSERINFRFAEGAERKCLPRMAKHDDRSSGSPWKLQITPSDWREIKRLWAEFREQWSRELVQGRGRRGEDLIDISELSESFLELMQGKSGGRSSSELTRSTFLQLPLHPLRLVSPASRETEVITGVSQRIKVLPSKQKPKVLRLSTSKQVEYRVLVKGGDDLRQDQRIQDIFSVFNVLAASQDASSGAGYSLMMRTYSVIPISRWVGLVEFLPDTMPLGDVMCTSLLPPKNSEGGERRGPQIDLKSLPAYAMYVERYSNGKVYLESLKVCKPTNKASDVEPPVDISGWFKELVVATPPHLLVQGLERIAPFASKWYEVRHTFLRTHCTLAMACYMFGIGDRHLSNHLVHMRDGAIIGIDFGFAFDSTVRFQYIPELVPVRHTPQIRAVQGVLGDAVSQCYMQFTVSFLRQNYQIFSGLASAFADAPIGNEPELLTAGSGEHGRQQRQREGKHKLRLLRWKLHDLHDPRDVLFHSVSYRKDVRESEELKAGLFALLYGRDVATQKRVTSSKNRSLSVPEYVGVLLQLSTDPNLLGRMWVGWLPFL